MQAYADTWAKTNGFSDSRIAGQTIKDYLDASERANIGRVQDLAYDRVRGRIAPQQRFIDADPLLFALKDPNNKLTGLIVNDLRNVAAQDPKKAGNLIALMEAGSAKDVGGLTFDEAVLLRTELNRVGRKYAGNPDPSIAGMGQAAITQATQLSKGIKQAVGKIDPQLRRGLEQADRQVSSIKDYFVDPKFMRFYDQLEDNPQIAVRELLKPNNAENIYRIRNVLEPRRAAQGRTTFTGPWKDVQSWFASEVIRESTANVKGRGAFVDGRKLAGFLDTYDQPTIDAIFAPNTWKELRLIARGLEEVERKPTGPGRVAIQLMLPGAVGGITYGGARLAGSDDPEAALWAIGAGAGTLMLPITFGAIITNPSLLRHFRDGIWEYRKSGIVPESLRVAIRQGTAQAASQYATQQGIGSSEQRVMQQRQAGLPPAPSSELPYTRPLPQISQLR
jgi:hypothetical protein